MLFCSSFQNCYEPDLSTLCAHGLIACEEAAQLSNQKESRSRLSDRLQHLKDLLAQFRGGVLH